VLVESDDLLGDVLVDGGVDGDVDGDADGDVRSPDRSPVRLFGDSVQPAAIVASSATAQKPLRNFLIATPPAEDRTGLNESNRGAVDLDRRAVSAVGMVYAG
jgi:hypothetical protein